MHWFISQLPHHLLHASRLVAPPTPVIESSRAEADPSAFTACKHTVCFVSRQVCTENFTPPLCLVLLLTLHPFSLARKCFMPGSTTAPLTYVRHRCDVVKYTLTDGKEKKLEKSYVAGSRTCDTSSAARGAKRLGHRRHVLQHTNGELFIYTIYIWLYAEIGGISACFCYHYRDGVKGSKRAH